LSQGVSGWLAVWGILFHHNNMVILPYLILFPSSNVDNNILNKIHIINLFT